MQKFRKGDVVLVSKEMPEWMSHFRSGEEACIIGSYKDQYGGDDDSEYTLMFLDGSSSSWYPEGLLTFLRHDPELAQSIKAQRAEYEARVSNLDWIFAHGDEVLKDRPIAALQALADVHGLGDLWGPNGEGMALQRNCEIILQCAEPFLRTGDKDGWLKFDPKKGPA